MQGRSDRTGLIGLAENLSSDSLVEGLQAASASLDQLAGARGRMLSHHLLSAEAAVGLRDGTPAGEAAVERYRRVLRQAGTTPRLGSALIRDWHAEIVGDAPDLMPGRYRERDSPGVDADLRGTVWTPPGPVAAARLVEEMVEFANGSVVHPIVKGAILSAQFEMVRPFSRANGRIARALLHWELGRRGYVVLPLAVAWSADPARLERGLDSWRGGEDPERWVGQVVADVLQVTRRCDELAASLEAWLASRRDGSEGRSGSLRRAILSGLPADPIVDAAEAAHRLGADPTRFSRVARQLVEAGILVPLPTEAKGVGRPPRRYRAPEVCAIVERWAKGLAQPTGASFIPSRERRTNRSEGSPAPDEQTRPSRGRPVPSKVRRPT